MVFAFDLLLMYHSHMDLENMKSDKVEKYRQDIVEPIEVYFSLILCCLVHMVPVFIIGV